MHRLAPLLLALLSTPLAAQHALSSGGSYDPAVPTPQSVLGYEVGEHFTKHHMLMRYLDRLAASSPRVRLDTVAHTFEGRELMMVIVTSEPNQRRLDQIRADAARIADPRGASAADLAAVTGRMPTIAWLGFTVHGPEASGAEAAIALLYQLAAGRDAETQMILDSVVVLIDPLQNPDGHERHAQDVTRMRTALGVPDHPDARIHNGTWPGPRTSHYYFDLNRDWYAMSHPETRGRTAAIMRWWPHVAVDLHEMSFNSTYFFPPTMEPINKIVHESILRWWDVYAEGLIETFDSNGWSFFRREGYDEFYPGYGSSWPLYLGAVGMTFEQASSRGGAIRRTDGTVLTLQEAARHHYGAAYSVLRTSARNARQRVRDYLAYRQSAISDAMRSPLRAVVIERDDQGRADSLAALLLRNGITVHRFRAATTIAGGAEYGGARGQSARVSAGSYMVDLAQPQGRLARALLEPDAPLDSAFIAEELERRRTGMSERFYDVTAWSLPLAFRVRAWGTSALPAGAEPLGEMPARETATAASARPRYGYAFAPGSEASIRLLGALLRDSVRIWFAPRGFTVGGARFPHGAFVVRAAANDTSVHARISRHAATTSAVVVPLASAAAAEGTDLGSNSVFPVRPPRVAILSGAPVNGQSYGYAWYAFDNRLGYPSAAFDVDAIMGRALDDFNVLVVPSVASGALSRLLGDAGRDRIASWVRNGGTLITLDAATDWLASERLGLSRLRVRSDTTKKDTTGLAPLPVDVPGAIVRAIGDTLSPLLVGVRPREIPVLLSSDRVYQAPRDVRPGELVLRFAPANRLRMAGYLWPEAPARVADTPYLWTERAGRGRVIAFAGDPNFRDLWRGLMPIFANAVFLGPNY
ncbi:MAG TPA: M14 family zinc carboxypeptidase [Gemmatimonadaceae bacterium]|nr:M14 family zinc carboxypeptidase [Gemmatimonadaceae bacterium]